MARIVMVVLAVVFDEALMIRMNAWLSGPKEDNVPTLTPKGPRGSKWAFVDFGQVPMNSINFFFFWDF